MRRAHFILVFLFIGFVSVAQQKTAVGQKKTKPVLVIHGGAGTILKTSMTPERETQYKALLELALNTGYDTLMKGGSAMDACEVAIRIMEDSPLFNAGKGSVFTSEGKIEMDAAVMDGASGKAGAVSGVRRVRNPVSAARAVMSKSPHVMLTGAGADAFAREQGLKLEDSSYFFTEERWKGLKRAKESEKIQLDHSDTTGSITPYKDYKYGTVGAVALDRNGNLAAATSTGGMTNKRWGRVGDAPIIGAGTYANNKTCAVSATGHGEFFIRNVVAYDISALMEYKGYSVKQAAESVVMGKLVKQGGEGGVIALDAKGNFAMPFNSAGMYRGYIKAEKGAKVFIYKED